MMKKRYIVIILILIAGTSLTVWKWNTWFGNPPEAVYATPQTPDRIILTLGENGENSRNVSWRCDTIVTSGQVEMVQANTTDTLEVEVEGSLIASRSGKSAFYQAKLTELVPGMKYNYRVRNGRQTSDWRSFQMPQPDSLFSFVYIGDIQDKTAGSTADIFRNIRHRHPDASFWGLGGDVIERPTDEYWTYWYSTMDSIAGQIPLIAATGNHEYLKGLVKILDPRWTHSFSNPENGSEGFAGRSYFIDFKDVCYIVLDTDGIQGPQSLYRHRAWLKQVLSVTTKKWKIVMMHHPVYSVRDGRNNYYVRWTFKPLFEEYGVALVLQGHDHGYSRITTKNEDEKQTPVYIVSSVSPKSYNIGFNPRHDRLASNLPLYQYITMKGDSLHFKAYTTDNRTYDDFIIVNPGTSSKVIDNAADWPESLELPPAYRNGKVDLEKYQKKVSEREARKLNKH